MLFEKEGALGLSLEPVTKPREPGVKLKAVKDGSPAVVLDRPSCCTTLEPGALLVALQEGGKAAVGLREMPYAGVIGQLKACGRPLTLHFETVTSGAGVAKAPAGRPPAAGAPPPGVAPSTSIATVDTPRKGTETHDVTITAPGALGIVWKKVETSGSKHSVPVVKLVRPDSSAAAAGVEMFEALVSIGDWQVIGKNYSDVIARIKGERPLRLSFAKEKIHLQAKATFVTQVRCTPGRCPVTAVTWPEKSSCLQGPLGFRWEAGPKQAGEPTVVRFEKEGPLGKS